MNYSYGKTFSGMLLILSEDGRKDSGIERKNIHRGKNISDISAGFIVRRRDTDPAGKFGRRKVFLFYLLSVFFRSWFGKRRNWV